MTVKPKIDLTPEVAISLMEKAVEKRGANYVYQQVKKKDAYGWENEACVYEHKGAPSCLVGEVLHEAGVTLSALKRFDKTDTGGITSLVDDGVLSIPKVTAQVLGVAQEAQDGGETWGGALRRAKVSAAALTDEAAQ